MSLGDVTGPDRTCPSCGRPTLLFNRTNGQVFCTRAIDGRCDYIGVVTQAVTS